MKNRIAGFALANRLRLAFFIAFGGIFLAACGGAGFETHERTIWYVSTTGDDANSCTEPDLACRTIVEAYDRADADDQINVAAGTYMEAGRFEDYPVFERVDISLRIVGAGTASTIIDLGNTYAGFYLVEGGRLRLENLTIQNARGNSPGGCVIVFDSGVLDAENVNMTRCYYAGIVIDAESEANLVNVSITETVTREPYGMGHGIWNLGGLLTIQGGEISRNTRAGVISTGNLEMNGTLLEGNALEGLELSGEANLTNITVQNNGGNLGHYDGIVIKGEANVSVTDSLITANNGRGIRIYGETHFTPPPDGVAEAGPNVLIQNTTISDHEMNGILTVAGTVTLDEVILEGNAISGGRALENGEALVEVRNSQLTGNGTGTIANSEDGEINVFETTIVNNSGNYPTVFNEGTMNIQNTLIANNTSIQRALENYSGDMLIANSTVSNNQVLGISLFQGNTTLSYVTIADNNGTGISASNFGEIHILLNNVLVARNSLGDCNFSNPDAPTPVLNGLNIATSFNCTFPLWFSSDEILLDGLADNGGPTLTQALLPGSPALDAATGICLEVDQRLSARPVGPACDVGAYEAGAVATSLESTPIPETDTLIVTQDFPCYTGPGAQYNTLSTLKAGTQMNIVGYSFSGGWFVASHPTILGSNCWIDEDFVETDVPVGELRLIAVPPKPTATPSPTTEPREEVKPTVCITVPPNNFTYCE